MALFFAFYCVIFFNFLPVSKREKKKKKKINRARKYERKLKVVVKLLLIKFLKSVFFIYIYSDSAFFATWDHYRF